MIEIITANVDLALFTKEMRKERLLYLLGSYSTAGMYRIFGKRTYSFVIMNLSSYQVEGFIIETKRNAHVVGISCCVDIYLITVKGMNDEQTHRSITDLC